MSVLLSTAYFPPVQYFAAMAKDFTLSPDRVNPSIAYMEACENYQKQSYRNRCVIYSQSGPEALVIPVVHEGGTHRIPIREIRIDYRNGWVMRHQRAIYSAYGTSAFFEYYKDGLFSIMDGRPEYLFDLNLSVIRFFIENTGLAVDIKMTDRYLPPQEAEDVYGNDLREVIHPKRPDRLMSLMGLEKPYFQVFSGRYGFIPGLSIMDLLFNEGPNSITFLKTLTAPAFRTGTR